MHICFSTIRQMEIPRRREHQKHSSLQTRSTIYIKPQLGPFYWQSFTRVFQSYAVNTPSSESAHRMFFNTAFGLLVLSQTILALPSYDKSSLVRRYDDGEGRGTCSPTNTPDDKTGGSPIQTCTISTKCGDCTASLYHGVSHQDDGSDNLDCYSGSIQCSRVWNLCNAELVIGNSKKVKSADVDSGLYGRGSVDLRDSNTWMCGKQGETQEPFGISLYLHRNIY